MEENNRIKEQLKEQLKEITGKLEQGIKEVFESDKYKEYLNTMSKFYNYSFNNTMLIAMQKPDATLVAGFHAWRNKFDRHVLKGEKGIRIIAPMPIRSKEEEETTMPAYKVTTVFDVSQTDGKELPDLTVEKLEGTVEKFEVFMAALTDAAPVPIGYEDIADGANGYYHLKDKRIAIQEGMSEIQTAKTAIHEIAHAALHGNRLKDQKTKEVEAESIAYTVCQHYGIDTAGYSFGYVAGWSLDKSLKELRSSLETIRKTSADLITSIDGKVAALQIAKEQKAEQELAYSFGDKFFSIHVCEEGYDYSIYDSDYSLWDGGVYDNPDISIYQAAREILEEEVVDLSDLKMLDFDTLEERTEAANKVMPQNNERGAEGTVSFTKPDHVQSPSLNQMTKAEVEEEVLAYAQDKLDEIGAKVTIKAVKVYGSRSRGLEHEGSDVDVALSYSGNMREDDMFSLLHEDGLFIGDMSVDINPISEEKTGTIEDYLTSANQYLDEKEKSRKEPEQSLDYFVAECMEFTDFGEYHEGLSIEEAVTVFESIPSERRNAGKGIGFVLHNANGMGNDSQEMEFPLYSGGIIDADTINHIPEFRDSPLVQQAMKDAIAQFPNAEVRDRETKEREAQKNSKPKSEEKPEEKRSIMEKLQAGKEKAAMRQEAAKPQREAAKNKEMEIG